MGGSNHKCNIIKLTYREHFIAHWLLWKAFDNKQMIWAFWFITNKSKNKISSRIYEQIREAHRSSLKGNKNARGKRSEESKLKMSLAQLNSDCHSTRGKKRLDFSKKISGKNNPMYGTISPTRGKSPHIKKTCPHCLTQGAGGGMTRFHFNNCKFIRIHIQSLSL
jgi:hypothetical protein